MSKSSLWLATLLIVTMAACSPGGSPPDSANTEASPPSTPLPAGAPEKPGSKAATPAASQAVFLLSYRTGPYGNYGTSVFSGWIDYMRLVNERGGINGVRLRWHECETEYNNSRGVECYDRLRARFPGEASMIHPVSTGIAYALLDKTRRDKVPLVMIGYGRTDAKLGRYFPYAFPLVTTYQMQASAMVRFLASRAKAAPAEALRGKKLALVFHDSAYGREPLEVLRAEALAREFELIEVPIAQPGLDQSGEWARLRQLDPDWVILWGWGEMTPAALQAAREAGYPLPRILGNWWSGAEEDVAALGDAATGYAAASFGTVGQQIPLVRDILDTLYAKGRGEMSDRSKVGSVLYIRGVLHGLLTAEAIRKAQEKFGVRPLGGEELQWGLEHLEIDRDRLAALGAAGMMPELRLSCADHEGAGKVMFQEWNGSGWRPISDYVEGDRELVGRLLDASARKYAEDNKLPIRDCRE